MDAKKRILLGVTGGIAAYKAAELVRLMVKRGLEVHVAMTAHAQEFVKPLTFQALSGNRVWTDTFELTSEHEIGHIKLVEMCDLVVVAPATANVLGKIASGVADDVLTTMVCAAARIPILLAPSMNVNMYRNPVTQANLRKLKAFGFHVLEPAEGDLACGYEGVGRLPEPGVILEHALSLLTPKDLRGETILVTAGPTHEEIDPVRFLTNRSSGKMGFALARAASRRGAEVILVSGPSACEVPIGVSCVSVRSAEEMYHAVLEAYPKATVVIMAAAVSDFRPAKREARKIKKGEGGFTLHLEKTPDILQELGKRKENQILIGFAAETESLIENAEIKRAKKNLDLIIVNDVSRRDIGFQSDQNEVKCIRRDGRVQELPLMPKEDLAHKILDQILELRSSRPQSEEALPGAAALARTARNLPSPDPVK